MSAKLLAVVLILTTALPAAPQQAPPSPPQQVPPLPPPDQGIPWTITGGRLEGTSAGATSLTEPRAVQGVTTITGDQGMWYRNEDVLNLTGHVTMSDTARTMTGERGTYDRRRGLGILTGRVHGMGPEGELWSHELWYWRDERRIELRDSVRLVQNAKTLTSRRLEYHLDTHRAVATDSVVIVDSSDSTRVTGQRYEFDRDSDWSVMTGNPTLHRPGKPGEADLDMTADTLTMRSGGRLGEAHGHVRIHRGSVVAQCGRSLLDFDQNLMHLRDGPVVIDPDGQVHGDSMAVVLRGGRAERLEVLGTARVRYHPPDKPEEKNIIMGDTLVALMDSSGVHELEVRGHARSLYIPTPADQRDQVGQNLARGLVIRASISGGQAKRVDLLQQSTGEYVLPRARADTSIARLPDSVYVARVIGRFLAEPDKPISDSLLRSGPFDPRETVAYSGDSVAFFVPEKRIEIRHNGKVHYQTMELNSNEIDYEASRDLVTALGVPTLKDQSSELVGKRMLYRMDHKQGFVYAGKTQFEGGFYTGEEIKRVEDKLLLVRGGDYTTCDKDTSDYHFHSWEMKIKTGDRVIARPIFLYVENIPLMALPYWVFPIRKGRHSGMLMPDVEFGFDRTRGRFVRNLGYYLAPNDYFDEMFWGDYYDQNPQWILNSQLRYNVRYKLSGSLFTSYTRQNVSGAKSSRWDIQGSHDQTLGNNATLKFRANFVSDKDYRDFRAFGGSVDERLNRILSSNIDLRKTWSSSSLSMTADRTENLDQTAGGIQIQQDLPSIDYSLSSFPIGRKPDDRGHGGRLPFLSTVYTRFSSSFRSTFTKPWGEKTQDNQAAEISTGLTDNRSLGSYLKLAPSINGNGAWVRRDALGKGNRFGAVWNAGVSAGTSLYGTFMPGLGPLLGIRHVIEPSVGYSFSPDFRSLTYRDANGQIQPRFPSVGGISIGGSKASSMTFSISQRVHLKLRGKEPTKPIRVDNLILWQTSSSYNFLTHTHPLSPISNSIRIAPAHFLDSSLNLTHDPYRKKPMTSLRLDTSVRLAGGGGKATSDTTRTQAPLEDYGGFGQASKNGGRPGQPELGAAGPWNVSLTDSYSRGQDRSSVSNTANLSASLTPTSAWRVTYSVYYDLQAHQVRSHGMSVYRDLHCWEMSLDQQSSGGASQYYFKIDIKSLQDVKYERQKR